MDRWIGKTAIVTGASSGIGYATAERLVLEGLQVVGLARRLEQMQQLATKLKGAKGKFYPIKCDVSEEKDILKAFEWVNKELNGADVLVNNAAVLISEKILDGATDGFRKSMEVNVVAMAICTREAVRSIRKRKVEAHIFNINSVAGHKVTPELPVAMYTASKHAVTVLTKSMQGELATTDDFIKVTSISPGLVQTEMPVGFGVNFSKCQRVECLDAKDVVNALIYALSTPSHVLISELTITPLKERMPAIIN